MLLIYKGRLNILFAQRELYLKSYLQYDKKMQDVIISKYIKTRMTTSIKAKLYTVGQTDINTEYKCILVEKK